MIDTLSNINTYYSWSPLFFRLYLACSFHFFYLDLSLFVQGFLAFTNVPLSFSPLYIGYLFIYLFLPLSLAYMFKTSKQSLEFQDTEWYNHHPELCQLRGLCLLWLWCHRYARLCERTTGWTSSFEYKVQYHQERPPQKVCFFKLTR